MSLDMNRLNERDVQLRCISTAVSDLIDESPDIAHLKDAQTKKYIKANSHWTEKLDLESTNDIVGHTYDDWSGADGIYTKWNFSPAFMFWKDSILKEMKMLEYQAQSTKTKAMKHVLGFTPEGFILFEECIKLPILSQDKKNVLAILTYSKDITYTLQHSLFDLLQVYKEYYPEQKSIQKLLMHLDIDYYFTELPTIEEITALLTMYQASDFWGVTSAPILFLRDKVKTSYWHEILTRLCALPVNAH